MTNKKRIDTLLIEKGIAQTIEIAKSIIMSGKILVDDLRVDKVGAMVKTDSKIIFKGEKTPYVSRGGIKLAEAIKKFNIEIKNLVCLDIGASTGGFTDCLLQHGAKQIFAIDVGYGQFAWRLRQDKRVTLIERKNIRNINKEDLPLLFDLAVIDVSFISLKIVTPAALKFLKKNGEIIALIKPQFEAAKNRVEKGGVIRNTSLHEMIIKNMISFFTEIGLECSTVIPSPIQGQKGNREFFIYLKKRLQ